MTDHIKSELAILADAVSSGALVSPERYCSRRLGGAILLPAKAPPADRLFFDGYKSWSNQDTVHSSETDFPVDRESSSIAEYQLFNIVFTSPLTGYKDFALVDWIDPLAGVVSLRWLPKIGRDTFSFNIVDFFPIAGEAIYDDTSIRHLSKSGLRWIPEASLF